MAQLNETLEKLQPMAEQLDPLETCYADVRFLDVDYEQTERQYESTMDDLRREIDEENELIDLAKQLEAELKNHQAAIKGANIEQLTHSSDQLIPHLYARLHELKTRIANAGKQRRIVRPSASIDKSEAMLSEVDASAKESLGVLAKKEQEAAIEEIQTKVHQLQTYATIEEIQFAEDKLQNLTFDNELVQELKQQLAAVKQHQAEKAKAKEQVNQQLGHLSEMLTQMHEAYPTAVKESTKSKKRKKAQQKPVAQTDRKTQIHELRRNVEELETQILPTLAKLKDESMKAELDISLPEQQQSRAVELVLFLKVGLLSGFLKSISLKLGK